jgi:hypothetical protein
MLLSYEPEIEVNYNTLRERNSVVGVAVESAFSIKDLY